MSARPRRYKVTKQISFRLNSELLEELDARAAALGVDRSQLINQLLTKNIEQNPYAFAEAPGTYKAKRKLPKPPQSKE